jgi:hypothetical protein
VIHSPDHLDADQYSALGEHPLLIVDAARWTAPVVRVHAVIIGVDREGALPRCDAAAFDILLTVAEAAPAPFVSVAAHRLDDHLADLEAAVRGWPLAATLLCQTLRATEHLPFSDALFTESLAYSALLGGAEFRRWRDMQSFAAAAAKAEHLILNIGEVDHITLTLNNPDQQNAMTAAMRDALYESLANALDDPTRPRVSLRGAGKCFSTGGSLPEFGSANDLAEAHMVRSLRSCARLVDALGTRIDVHFHGACIGSGLEIPAAAARRTASANALFQLPELRMGLIPGAGGTATVARAIGRQRTTWLVLSGKRIGAMQALQWGLIHEIIS